MPACPPKPCVHPGCRSLAEPGKARCSAHANTYDQTVRANSPALRRAQRIRNSRQWQVVRHNFRIANPICCDPFKEHKYGPEPMSDVHHVIPLIEQAGLAFSDSNLRPLCTKCHARVEQMERQGEPTQQLFQTNAQTA